MSSPYRVALVDDDPSMLVATSNLLQAFGYSVETFTSAEQFIASGMASSTGCLITDMHMSGMSGLELLAYMSRHRFPASIIFNTGFPDKQLEQRAFKAGALCFLAKPFDAQTLADCIERAKAREA